MKNIIPILIVGTLVLSGIGAIALPDINEQNIVNEKYGFFSILFCPLAEWA